MHQCHQDLALPDPQALLRKKVLSRGHCQICDRACFETMRQRITTIRRGDVWTAALGIRNPYQTHTLALRSTKASNDPKLAG